jgi:hypothetical protein
MDDRLMHGMLYELRAVRVLLEQRLKPLEQARKKQGERAPSSRWMTTKEVAGHFCVSEATVRLGRGVFAHLRRVPVTEKRVVYVRTDVERLSRMLERTAVAIAPDSGRLS